MIENTLWATSGLRQSGPLVLWSSCWSGLVLLALVWLWFGSGLVLRQDQPEPSGFPDVSVCFGTYMLCPLPKTKSQSPPLGKFPLVPLPLRSPCSLPAAYPPLVATCRSYHLLASSDPALVVLARCCPCSPCVPSPARPLPSLHDTMSPSKRTAAPSAQRSALSLLDWRARSAAFASGPSCSAFVFPPTLLPACPLPPPRAAPAIHTWCAPSPVLLLTPCFSTTLARSLPILCRVRSTLCIAVVRASTPSWRCDRRVTLQALSRTRRRRARQVWHAWRGRRGFVNARRNVAGMTCVSRRHCAGHHGCTHIFVCFCK
jgi:hypothetical protein